MTPAAFAKRLLNALQSDPRNTFRMGLAFLRGLYYSAYYRIFRRDVTIRLPFFVYYRLNISGPGTVFIDRGCSVFPNAFDGLTIATLSPDARVSIGSACDLGGVTIRCRRRISIGARGLFANCLLQDSLFSEIPPLNSPALTAPGASGEISIGNSVWVAGQTLVLPGSILGDESVLSVGSTCIAFDVPTKHLATGNPVSTAQDIARIMKFLSSR